MYILLWDIYFYHRIYFCHVVYFYNETCSDHDVYFHEGIYIKLRVIFTKKYIFPKGDILTIGLVYQTGAKNRLFCFQYFPSLFGQPLICLMSPIMVPTTMQGK